MLTVIFRTCKQHDYLCRLSYTSYKMFGIGDRFVFLCQKDQPFTHIADLTDGEYTFHEADGNFGGQMSVKALWAALRRVGNISHEDTIFLSDSDIIMMSSPLDYINSSPWDHRGVMCTYPNKNILHSSGQCQILKGNIINRLRQQTNEYIDSVWMKEMVPAGISVADDTFLSWETDKMGVLKIPMPAPNPYWVHGKYCGLKHKFGTDYTAAVKYIQSDTTRAGDKGNECL